MVRKNIKKSWSAYKRNYKELIKAIIIKDGLSLLVLILFGYLIMINYVDMYAVWPFLIVIYIISTVLQGGFVKMCYESLRGKTKTECMFETAKKRWASLLGASLLMAVGIIVSFVILLAIGALIFNPQSASFWIAIVLLAFLAMFLVFLMFSFVNQSVVIDNKSARDSIGKSISVAKKSYKKMFSVFIITFLALFTSKLILGIVPQVGAILDLLFSQLVIVPIMLLTITSIYVEGRKKR